MVGFTVVSLMLVAAVGVVAHSGKSESSNTLKNSVVALFSVHSDQTGVHNDASGTTDKKGGSGEGQGERHNGKDKEKDKDKEDDQCKPKDDDATHGREHHDCGDADHDSG